MEKIKKKIESGRGSRSHAKDSNASSLPIISIITATYNAEKDLEQCIISVLGQSYENVELIIIDGGSSDATLDIIKKYEAQIDYWVSETDQGIYDAFNKGIDVARGEWLYFLGADDNLANESVLQHIFSNSYDSKLLYGNVRWGRSGIIYDGKFTRLKLFRFNICQQAIFYHRDLFNTLGKFDPRYLVEADWVFNMKAFAVNNTRPFYLNTIVADYCIDGMSSVNEDEKLYREREMIYQDCFGSFTLFWAKLSHFLGTRILSVDRNK